MRIVATGCCLFLMAAPLAAQDYAVDRGVWQVGGTARFSRFTDQRSGLHNTTLEMNPRLGFFLLPGLALTANVKLARYSNDAGYTWDYGVGPGLTYYLFHDARRVHPFVSVRTLLSRTQSTVTTGGGGSFRDDGFDWVASGGAMVLVSRNVGLTGELFYARNHFTYSNGTFESSGSTEEYGSQFGVSVYLF